MQLFSHFPFLTDMIDEDVADQLERRFLRVCEAAGLSPASPEALPIGIEIMADYATGLACTASANRRTAMEVSGRHQSLFVDEHASRNG